MSVTINSPHAEAAENLDAEQMAQAGDGIGPGIEGAPYQEDASGQEQSPATDTIPDEAYAEEAVYANPEGPDDESSTVLHHKAGGASPDPDAKDVIVECGMGFKMPVADYTMVSFHVSIRKPCKDGGETECFTDLKHWAEARINALVGEQMAAMQPGAQPAMQPAVNPGSPTPTGASLPAAPETF